MINGDTWIAKIVSKKEMNKQSGDEDTEALCIAEDKTMLFLKDKLTINHIRHEVGHAFWSTLCLDSTTQISREDIEEIAVSLFASKGPDIIRTSNIIFKALCSK